jgi:parallel beta-helix repeat protein
MCLGGPIVKRKIISIVLCSILILSTFILFDFKFGLVEVVEGETLYVNTTGLNGAYTSIQDAINATSDGDTVFVYSGTYYENLIVNTSINLIGEDRERTIINGSNIGDIIGIRINNVSIDNFTIIGYGSPFWYAGIKLDNINNCSVHSCNISHTNRGIQLFYSDNNTIGDNNLSNNSYDIYQECSNNNTIEKNHIYCGIYLKYSETNIFAQNEIQFCDTGLYMWRSNNNQLDNNTINNTEYGIRIEYSINNNIIDNKLSFNDYGIYLDSSLECNLESNIMVEDGIIISGDSVEDWNTHNIESSNTLNGKPVYYGKNLKNLTIPLGYGQIILANCSYCLIEHQNITKTAIPIRLGHSTYNKIKNNNLSSNLGGISTSFSYYNDIIKNELINNTYGCGIGGGWNSFISNKVLNNFYGISLGSYNNISDNNISKNYYGIYSMAGAYNMIFQNNISFNNYSVYFHDSYENYIYNNNFINNPQHVIDHYWSYWDYGYPIGGNYWSDYVGNDSYKGPNQDQEGGDGIGDTPYEVYFSHKDNYPLMEPYSYKPMENHTILKQGWNLISIPLIQQNPNLQKVLEMIDGYYDAVQWYKPIDNYNPWKHNKVGKSFGNDLFELNETMGFWIHIINPGDTIFLYNGTQPTKNQTITFQKGWNMVGYPSLSYYNRTVGLNNLTFGSQVDAIWTYDVSTQKWNEIGESDYFELGKGYYIHAKSECVWEVPL